MFWELTALILYSLVPLAIFREADEHLEDLKQDMRDMGLWYPSLAWPILIILAIAWPAVAVHHIIFGYEDKEE